MRVRNYREILLWALALRRLEMARESKKCPPGSTPLNPPGWFPVEVIPPGTEIPDGELPPEEEPEEPEPEEPPHEGDTVSEGDTEQSSESDEILEEVVLGGVSFVETAEEEDAIAEDVVESPLPSPALVLEGLIDRSRESDQVLEDVVLAPPTHVPQIYNQGLIDQTRETDLVSEQVIVADPEPEDPDLPPPPPTGSWDRILQNISLQGDVVVPDGKRWLIGPNVKIQGNLRTVGGTIGMRPGSSLEFVGGDPTKYVGKGMTYAPEFANDYGIWIGDHGVLDIRGTPKVGWNRSGVDPTWAAGDEYWIAPTAKGDYVPKMWFPGQAVPRVHSSLPPTEVVNVTRDIVIKGSPTGHIHIHSHHPQIIEYCRLENMGVFIPGTGATSGRYALHFHHGFDGTRGTHVKGVAIVNAKGRAFVPHLSHGITFTDCVSLNSWFEAYWWDVGDDTDDMLWDRCVALGVATPEGMTQSTPRFDAFTLGSGHNMEIRNCVASGCRGNDLTVGFDWVSGGEAPNPIWIFERGNVAHNNSGPGIRFWTNGPHEHIVEDYISYRNGIAGIENGAYLNRVAYRDVICYDESATKPSGEKAGVLWHVNARGGSELVDAVIVASIGPAILVGARQLITPAYAEFRNCQLTAATGQPLVLVDKGNSNTKLWKAKFIECTKGTSTPFAPTDIVFQTSDKNVGSLVEIHDASGPRWLVEYQAGAAGNRKVTAL